ncbi:hypothetical protein [Romboutsia ilealis]|uniref:hypothetical protein n=1 Tax=Romboutsia ilealis TaxID=1115758 RepID=UPI00272D1503|nr:hypothetical protein [Romboutsia ilealis]
MYDDILIPLREILHNNEIRICSNPECKKIMVEGYVIENGMEYYCCEECLHTEITEEEFIELYDDGEGDSYYTEWDYCIHTLKAINKLVEEAPVLQAGELGIVPMTNINKLNK